MAQKEKTINILSLTIAKYYATIKNNPPPPPPLSLHDALPICKCLHINSPNFQQVPKMQFGKKKLVRVLKMQIAKLS